MTKDSKWLQMFEALERFGKIPWYGKKGSIEAKLTEWCSEQRLKYQKGILLPDRRSKLETLSYWYWDPDVEFLNKMIAGAYHSKNISMSRSRFISKKIEKSMAKREAKRKAKRKANPKSISKSKRQPKNGKIKL